MGLATAQLLAARGAVISIADINEDAMKAAVTSLTDSEKHMYRVVDVCESEAVNAWTQSIIEKFGRLDGAVNMAGIIRPAVEVMSMTDGDWDLTMAVNTRGVFNCIRAQVRAMKDSGSIV